MASKQQDQLVGKDLALHAARLADEKQAEDIEVLDVRDQSSVTDFFVLCSTSSMPHLRAVHREIRDRLSTEEEVKTLANDGQPESQWMVLDYVDVIVHVFHQEKREFYGLEDLWSDAPRVEWAS